MKKNYLLLCSLFLFVSSIQLGFGQSLENKMKSEFSVKNNAIPKDFDGANTTIIVVLRDGLGYRGYLKRGFSKNYFGKHEFVKFKDLDNEEYSNVNKYRYFFDYSSGSLYQTGGAILVLKRFHVFDRLTQEKYECGAEFQRVGKAIKVYATNLERRRKINRAKKR